MPTIDTLDFKLIVDDASFNQTIQNAIANAQTLNTALSNLLNLQQQVVQGGQNINPQVLQQMQAQISLLEQQVKALQQIGNQGHNLKGAFGGLGAEIASVFSADRLREFLGELVKVSGEIELQKTSLRAIIGDIQASDAIFDNLKDLSMRSPYTFSQLTSYAKQLSAFSIPTEQLYETTNMLADVASGLGVDMARINLAFGQIKSAAFLRGQEVRQLTEAGIPILDELAKKFAQIEGHAVTTGEVFDRISKRKVSFGMVEEVFKNLTSEGGKFYQMQEVQAETLKVKVSNLTNAYQLMLAEIGDKNSGILKGSVEGLTDLIKNYEEVGKVIVQGVSAFGLYRVVMAAQTVNINSLVRVLATLRNAYRNLNTVITKAIPNPYVAVAAAVAALAVKYVQASREANKFHRELYANVDTGFKDAEKQVKYFDELVEKLKNASYGTKEYSAAISEINSKYGDYLPQLLNEKDALDQIASSSRIVTEGIYARAKAYSYENGLKGVSDKYDQDIANENAQMLEKLQSKGLNEKEALDVIKIFTQKIREDGKKNPVTALNEAFKEYTDTNKNLVGAMGRVGNAIKNQSVIFNGLDRNGMAIMTLTESLGDVANNYAQYVRASDSALKSVENHIESLYSGNTGYSTSKERDTIENINNIYLNRSKVLREELDKVGKQYGVASDEYKVALDDYNAKLNQLNVDKLKDLESAYTALGRPELANKVGSELSSLTMKFNDWRDAVKEIVDKQTRTDFKNLYGVDEATAASEYIDKLQKQYKELEYERKQYTDASNPRVKEIQEEMRLIEQLGKAGGFRVDSKVRSATKEENDRISALKNEINVIEKLKEKYLKFREIGLSDRQAKDSLLQGFPNFSELISRGDYDRVIEDKTKMLASLDPQEAKVAGEKYGFTLIDALIDAIEAKKSVQDIVQDYLDSAMEISGEGVANDISKVLANLERTIAKRTTKLNDDISKIQSKSQTTQNTTEATDFAKQLQTINEAYDTLVDSDKSKALEQVRDLVDKYLKEWAKVNEIDLSGFNSQTLGQMNNLISLLDTAIVSLDDFLLGADNVDLSKILPESILASFGNNTDALNTFVKSLREAVALIQGEASKSMSKGTGSIFESLFPQNENETEQDYEQRLNGIKRLASGIAQSLGKVADAVGEYGETIDNEFLSVMSSVMSVGKDILNGFKSGDWIGAVVAGVASVTSLLIDSQTEAAKLAIAIREVQLESEILSMDDKLNSGKGMFGESFSASIKAAMDVIDMAREKMKAFPNEFADMLKTFTEYAEQYGGDASIYERMLGAIDESLPDKFVEIRKGLFKKSSTTIQALIGELGYDLTDAYGNLNSVALKSILDTYPKLNKADKEWIETAIKYTDEYAKAMEQLEGKIEDIFADLGKNIASSMITAFEKTGDSLGNLEEAFQDAGKQLTQSLLSSMLMDTVLNNYRDKFIAMTQSYGKGDLSETQMMGQVAELMGQMQDDIRLTSDVYDAILQYAKELGWIGDQQSSNAGSASSVKNITEDTANLLVSYVNAIRADVSMIRTQHGESLEVLKQMLADMPTAPSLSYYLEQINSNTYNTAIAAQSILARLDSVITTESGPASIRTYGY